MAVAIRIPYQRIVIGPICKAIAPGELNMRLSAYRAGGALDSRHVVAICNVTILQHRRSSGWTTERTLGSQPSGGTCGRPGPFRMRTLEEASHDALGAEHDERAHPLARLGGPPGLRGGRGG